MYKRLLALVLALTLGLGLMLPAASAASVFTDVYDNAYYAKAVEWAVENGVTAGLDKTHFGPNNPCTRGHVVTFLWRAAGKPEPKTSKTAFVDLDKKAFYYTAVLWAVENGITAGVSKDKFAPGNTCTRGQIVTFLWRYAGMQEAAASGGFTDVAGSAFYAKAVNWAVANGITSGIGNGLFAPSNVCTRGQVVTFLYRLASSGDKSRLNPDELAKERNNGVDQVRRELGGSFKMMGLDYSDGLTFRSDDTYRPDNYAVFHLGGQVSQVSFDLGHVDMNGESDGRLVINLDGKDMDPIALAHNMITVHIDLNTTGIQTMKLTVTGDGYCTFVYGMGNLRKVEASLSSRPGTVVSTPIAATNLKAGQAVLPYQYTTAKNRNVTVYPAEEPFTMMGYDYDNGLVYLSNDVHKPLSEALFNLGASWSTLSFDVSHVDWSGLSDASLEIVLDGKVAQTIPLAHNMQTTHVTVHVADIIQANLRVTCSGYGTYQIGVTNLKLDIGSAEGRPGDLDTAFVARTTVRPGANLVPYEYSTSKNQDVTVYTKEDLMTYFTMMGVEYDYGCVYTFNDSYNPSAEILYNLGGAFTSLSFDLGHIDGSGDSDAAMKLWLDGVCVQTVPLSHHMSTTHYALDVSGKSQLRLEICHSDGYATTAFGVTNLTLDDSAAGPETMTSELVKNTPVRDGEHQVPYQYTTANNRSVKLYTKEDLMTYFTMMGVQYEYGITFTFHDVYRPLSEAAFNLGGRFTEISFDLGHVDGSGSSNMTMNVYLDDKLADTRSLAHTMATAHYTLSCADATQLRVELLGENGYYTSAFGLANITFTAGSGSGSGEAAVTPVLDTPLRGGSILPYDAYKSNNGVLVTNYDGAGDSFRMMGVRYDRGVTFASNDVYQPWGEAMVNLGGKFSEVSFDLGRVDAQGWSGATLELWLDGELAKTYALDSFQPTTHVVLTTGGKSQLRIVVKNESGYATCCFALANLTAVEGSGGEAGTASEQLVMNTTAKLNEPILPYDSMSAKNYPVTNYDGTGDGFTMGGTKFAQGITVYSKDVYRPVFSTLFNLGGRAAELRFTLGHLDDGGDGQAVLKAYADGELVQTIDLRKDLTNGVIRIPVSGKSQLRLEFSWTSGYATFGYGLADIMAIN